jgi:hypothetical protein
MITIVFCIPGRTFSDRFLDSWSSLLSHCYEFNINPMLRLAHSNNIYLVRNLCLMGDKKGGASQKPFQGKVDYDYIMWIDSDNIFTAQQFKDLLDTIESNKNIPILAGIYLAEDRKRYLAHYLPGDKFSKKFKSEFVKPEHIKKLPKKPFEVLFTGMGFMLVRYGVFESLSYPWVEPIVQEYKGGQKVIVGDDTSFCLKAKDAGFATYIDPGVIVGHEKPVVLI